jgi:hypothetical protein
MLNSKKASKINLRSAFEVADYQTCTLEDVCTGPSQVDQDILEYQLAHEEHVRETLSNASLVQSTRDFASLPDPEEMKVMELDECTSNREPQMTLELPDIDFNTESQ